jgi:uncharacterized protein
MFTRFLLAGFILLATTIYGGMSMAASPEDNTRIITDYYAAYAAGDIEKIASFYADDIEWHIPGQHPLAGTKKGKAEVAAFFEQLGRSGFRAELIALTADENWVIDMHRGWSTRPDGNNVDTVWALAFRIENGKIAEARNFAFDQAAANDFFWKAYPLKPIPDRLAGDN